MKKKDTLSSFFIMLFFIGVPAIIGFWLYLPDWENSKRQTWFYWALSIGFLFYVFIISYIFIHFNFLLIDSLNYIIPMSLALITIFLSWNLHVGIRILLIILMVLTAFPTNVLIDKIKKVF